MDPTGDRSNAVALSIISTCLPNRCSTIYIASRNILNSKTYHTRMDSSRMRTVRYSGRLGVVCLGGCLPKGLSAQGVLPKGVSA